MGKKPEIPPEDLVECEDCDVKLPEDDLAYTEHHGRLCVKCYKKEYPSHILNPTEGSWERLRKDILVIPVPGGVVAVDIPSGVAGFGKTKAKAQKILDKAISDIETVERNERYGSCME